MAWSVLRGGEALLESSWYIVGAHRSTSISFPEEAWNGDWAVQKYAPWELSMLVASLVATVIPYFGGIVVSTGGSRGTTILLAVLFTSLLVRGTTWAVGDLLNLHTLEGFLLYLHPFVSHPVAVSILAWLFMPRERSLWDYFRYGTPPMVLTMAVYVGMYALTAVDMNDEVSRIFFVVVLPQIAGGLSFHCYARAICNITPVRDSDLVAVIMMVLPVSISAYSNFMQFAANSYASATLAEVVQLVMELSQHHSMLKGHTSIDRLYLFTTNAYSCVLRLFGPYAARHQSDSSMSSVMPADSVDVVGKPSEYDDDATLAKTRPAGGSGAAPRRLSDFFRRSLRSSISGISSFVQVVVLGEVHDRPEILGSVVMYLNIVEVTVICATALAYLILPLRPGGRAVPVDQVLFTAAMKLVGELLTDLLGISMSYRWSQKSGSAYRSYTKNWQHGSTSALFILAFFTPASIVYSFILAIGSWCVYPEGADNRTVQSFALCESPQS
eukprot:TRINITY_DN7768_c0_g2_i1.p1 TRINITY_DN7768_c0_g2~~TRINITY_DN7768_c0_g2_i1.p1  ORF type:complete len:548 (-),score=18.30 TRINITY_DN7768_c0_g2_i1:78-1571(-)